MEAILPTAQRLSGLAPDLLIHAPLPHPLNVTPYASLSPAFPYDLTLCAGKNAILFATQDKAETLGLWEEAVRHGVRTLTVVWPNEWGGKSMSKYLSAPAATEAKHHMRFAFMAHPAADPSWREAASPKLVSGTALFAQAGLFSYREIDAGSALLAAHLPPLSGEVADFGCGWGFLSDCILKSCPEVTRLHALDDDIRAVNRTRDNIQDNRLVTHHADIAQKVLVKFDAVVMNPPFHAKGHERKSLGRTFLTAAAGTLKPGGALYMVANRHLPYEKTLRNFFALSTVLADEKGFKVIKAVKGDT